MRCPECNMELPTGAARCACGYDLISQRVLAPFLVGKPDFNAISTRKLLLLSFFTFGIYDLIWFYKQWTAVRIADGSNISPMGRAFFSIFYCNSFFKRVRSHIGGTAESSEFSAGPLSAVYILFSLLANFEGRIEGPWALISFLRLYPLFKVQTAINEMQEDAPTDLNRMNIAICCFFGVFWFGYLVSLIAPATPA